MVQYWFILNANMASNRNKWSVVLKRERAIKPSLFAFLFDKSEEYAPEVKL